MDEKYLTHSEYPICLTLPALTEKVKTAPTKEEALEALLDQLMSFGYTEPVKAYREWKGEDQNGEIT